MNEKKHHKEEREGAEDDVLIEDEEDSNATAAQKLSTLKERLRKCTKEREEYLHGWQRARADYANARRETSEARSAAHKEGKQELLRDLLTVVDSFDMAFSGEAWGSVDAEWRKGVEYIYQQFLRAMEDHGVERVNPVGKPFDPAYHESMNTVPASRKKDDGMVAEVIQQGFVLDGDVLRPARVNVFTSDNE